MSLQDFKCKNCGFIHCQTNGRYYVRTVEGDKEKVFRKKKIFICEQCGEIRVWRQKEESRQEKV